MSPHRSFLYCLMICTVSSAAEPAKSNNALVTALQFTHCYAKSESLKPDQDRTIKTNWITTLAGKNPEISWESVREIFEKETFFKLSGGKNTITLETMERLVQDTAPASRQAILVKVRQHADLLTTQFDLIEEKHRTAVEDFVTWIVKNYKPGQTLGTIIICTGNTRRSMLGSTMGNLAASYYGLTDLKFYSGGTDPSAFNPRTISTLKSMGVDIEPTGKEAPHGKGDDANPIYRVKWGEGLETVEFSKKYNDAPNPKTGFAALLVCSEADTACPKVTGASIRIPVPYLDPKAFDGATFESAKYAERRDDIGRFMLCACMQARRRLEAEGKWK